MFLTPPSMQNEILKMSKKYANKYQQCIGITNKENHHTYFNNPNIKMKTQTHIEDNSIYMDCESISNQELLKSSISYLDTNEDALEIISTDSSSYFSHRSEMNVLTKNESIPFFDILSEKSDKEHDKRTGPDIPACEYVMCETLPTLVPKYDQCRYHRHSKIDQIQAYQRYEQSQDTLSDSSDGPSENTMYYNKPQIDNLDIFKPETVGKNYFKTTDSTKRERICHRYEEEKGKSNVVDLRERIHLSTQGMTYTNENDDRSILEDSFIVPSNNEFDSKSFEDFKTPTYYYSPIKIKGKTYIDVDIFSNKVRNEKHLLNTVPSIVKNLSSTRLKKSLDLLAEKDKIILWNFLQHQKTSRKVKIVCQTPIFQNNIAIVFGKLLEQYSRLYVRRCKTKRGKIKRKSQKSKRIPRHQTFSKQCHLSKSTAQRNNSIALNNKRNGKMNVTFKIDETLARKKKDQNSNRTTLQNATAGRRTSFLKSLRQVKSPSNFDMRLKCLSKVKTESTKRPQVCTKGKNFASDIKHKTANPSPEMNKIVETKENIKQDQLLPHCQVNIGSPLADSKTLNELIPKRRMISSDDIDGCFTKKNKQSFSTAIQNFREKFKAINLNTKDFLPTRDTESKYSKSDYNNTVTNERLCEADVNKNKKVQINSGSFQNKQAPKHELHKRTNNIDEKDKTWLPFGSNIGKRNEMVGSNSSLVFKKEKKFDGISLRYPFNKKTISKQEDKRNVELNHLFKNDIETNSKFRLGREIHAELDRPSGTTPQGKTDERQSRYSHTTSKTAVRIPRLQLMSSTLPNGGDGTKLWGEERIRLQVESKNLDKEVQSNVYKSNVLVQESGDIVKSIRYGEFHVPKLSPISFERLSTSKDIEVQKEPTQCFRTFLRNPVECKAISTKPQNNYLEGFLNKVSNNNRTMMKEVGTLKVPSPPIDNPLSSKPRDPEDTIRQYQGHTVTTPVAHTDLHIETPRHKNDKINIEETAKDLNTKHNLTRNTNAVVYNNRKTNLNNRKLVSFTYDADKNLGVSLPEVTYYRPNENKTFTNDIYTEYSSQESLNKQNVNASIHFTTHKGKMSKVTKPKPTAMQRLRITKPRIWSSLQRKASVNHIADSEHMVRTDVLSSVGQNKHVLTSDGIERKQKGNEQKFKTTRINNLYDSCTQTMPTKRSNNWYSDQSKSSKNTIPREFNKISKSSDSNSYTQEQKRQKLSHRHHTGNHKKANDNEFNKVLPEIPCNQWSHAFSTDVSGSDSRLLDAPSDKICPPKIYLESARTSFDSNYGASQMRREKSILSSSMGSLSSSQFYEFIYPPKQQANKNSGYERIGDSKYNQATYKIAKVRCDPRVDSKPKNGNLQRNNAKTQPKWKLRSDRNHDSINTNERVWSWINGSDSSNIDKKRRLSRQRQEGRYDESRHGHDHNSNDQYPKRNESLGDISIQPYRRSSSLPSKLISRPRLTMHSNLYPENAIFNTHRRYYSPELRRGRDLNIQSYSRKSDWPWSPQRSVPSISAKPYMQMYLGGKKIQKKIENSRKGAYTGNDFNHAHTPSDIPIYEPDGRFNDFENKVQDQISKRSEDSINAYVETDLDKPKIERNGQEKSELLQSSGSNYETGCDPCRRYGGPYRFYKPRYAYYKTCDPCFKSCDPCNEMPKASDPCCENLTSSGPSSEKYGYRSREMEKFTHPCGGQRNYRSSKTYFADKCYEEPKMYAWPPMFVGTRHYKCQEQACCTPKCNRANQRLNPLDIQANDRNMPNCKSNYILKKYSGISDCGDVAKTVRQEYLKNMRLVTIGPGLFGEGGEPFLEIRGTTAGEHRSQDDPDSFNVSLIPSPPRVHQQRHRRSP